MPEKPNPTAGKTQKKRKRDNVASTSKEDGNHVSGTNNPKYIEDSSRQGQLNHCSSDEIEDIYPTILPGFTTSFSAPDDRDISVEGRLCSRCANIDLNTLLSRPHKTQAGRAAEKLRPAPSWDDSCTLCSLFRSTMGSYWTSETREKVPVRTYSSNKMVDSFWSSISTNLLQVGHGRYLVSQPEGTRGPVKFIKKEIGSFECVKHWIGFCTRAHKICNLETRSSVSGLKLIDCDTRTLVSGQDQPYVALSYVWGPQSDISEDSFTLLPKMPNTIEDAITVTKRLDYRYLWIDRYCIDQNNVHEKADQCEKMDLIYQNAELTIIAAVGNNPNYGLPGVGSRKRSSRHSTTCTKIGNRFLISIEEWPKTAVESTRWNKRAWTFQESLLSRRRLVFAKEQMYFECYGMYCFESLDLPLESMHRKDMQGFKSIYCSDKLVGIFPKGVGTTAMEIVKRIQEYVGRNLTDQTDILKGMLGIFHAFQESRLKILHCGGIPILPSKLGRSDGKHIEGWTPAMGFFLGLFWNLENLSDRRYGFPSWSWTGWHGPAKWAEWDYFWPSIHIDPNVEVWVKLLNGQLRTLDDLHIWSTQSGITGIIHIKAWTIEIKILKNIYKEKEGKYLARLELEDGGHLGWNFESISKAAISPGEVCKGIILGQNLDDDDQFLVPGQYLGPVILVCAEVGGTMERISISRISSFHYSRYDENGVEEVRHHSLSLEEHLSGRPLPRPRNPRFADPPELVKSWEEIQLG